MARSRTGRRLPKPRAEQANNNAAAKHEPDEIDEQGHPQQPRRHPGRTGFSAG